MNPSKGTVRRSSAPVLRSHPHLFEINTWAWLEELSARAGHSITLDAVPVSEWDKLQQLGFDIVWLMGVWRRSPASREIALAEPANRPLYDRALPGWTSADVVGSPYAVAEYAPDRRIGTWGSLDRAREELHQRGIALFLDFVGNHTALDHPWTSAHPEFYVQGAAGDFAKDPASFHRIEGTNGPVFLALAKDPYFPPWKDAAQLNHFNPKMRAAQLAQLRTIAAHCDGVRCDMAMLHLNDIFANQWACFLKNPKPPKTEFWAAAHKAVPRLVLLAEAYWGTEQRLLDLGFSFAYDKSLYDALRDANVPKAQAGLAAAPSVEGHFARFLENHDEARCASAFGKQRLPGAATLMGTLPGMRFYHQGELEGRSAFLPITLRMQANAPPDPEIFALFAKILQITNDDAFHSGTWNLLPVVPEGDGTAGNLAVYEWRSAKSWKVIVGNLAGNAAQGRVKLGDRVSTAAQYIFYDQLNDVRYERSGEELRNLGLFVRREAFQAHLFDVSSAQPPPQTGEAHT